MIKDDGDKLEIYSQVNIPKIKLASTLFAATIIMLIFNLIFSFTYFYLILFILSLLLEAFCIYVLRRPNEPKLRVRLTKEYLEIYKRKKVEKYDMSKIINFSCDSNSSTNEVFVNYYNEKGKKCCKPFFLIGCTNLKFVDIANSLKSENESVKNINLNEYDSSKGKKDLFDLLYDNQELKLYFIGKSKLVLNTGNPLSFPQFPAQFFFIDDCGNVIDFYYHEMLIEPIKLFSNNFFIVRYNKKKKMFCFTPINDNFDLELVNNFKNKIEIRNSLLFDVESIKREYNIERKYFIFRRIIQILLLIAIGLLFINKDIGCISFLFVLISFSVYMYVLKKQCIQ